MATQFQPRQEQLVITSEEQLPSAYAMVGQGSCMEPLYSDGDCLAFVKNRPPENGDVVILWFKPGYLPAGDTQCRLKRAVTLPPIGVIGSEPADSEVIPLVVVEMLNPPRRFSIPATRLLAIHKCVGLATPSENGMAMVRESQLSGEG